MDDHIRRLLEMLEQPNYRPRTTRNLARRLDVPDDDIPIFRAQVRELVKAGRIRRAKDKTLSLAGAAPAPRESSQILGTFRRNARGFGFVRPLAARSGGPRPPDIFIAPDDTSDASTGDEVAVKITERAKSSDRGPRGRIVRVVTRAAGLFVGTYFEQYGEGFVKVDGTTFHEPLSVGDPGAKGARPGDKVAVEIVRYPSPAQEGEGVITEVLGPRGQPGVDTLSIIRAFNLADAFDEAVLEEAREQARDFDENQLDGRLDLRDQLTLTIDPTTARDFDDAISLDRDERGHWTLGVHIADVGHYVRPGSALDNSARKRGTSVYLPDRVLPMLPEVLSNSLASLQEGKTRFTMTVFIDFDPTGIVTATRFARSAIRVDRRFTYEEAFATLQDPAAAIAAATVSEPIVALLRRMLELAMLLRRRRFTRGALELVMPEVEVDLGNEGEVVGAHLAADDASHQVIEEFMLAANEAVAAHLSANDAPFLRRVHADPEPVKLEQFAEFVRGLGFEIEDPRSRFELQKVLRASDDKPERHAVHYALLRSLKQAVYTPEAEGHYALASDDYCHFTSPIRRYPDLQVHRQLAALLAGKRPRGDIDELTVLAEHCTRAERRAEAAERELIRLKLLAHLEPQVGRAFHAVIIGVEDFGLFCQLVELPVEGLLHVSSLVGDYYYLEPESHTLIGRRRGTRYRLGDRLEVRIARVDIDRRELDLHLAASPPPGTDEQGESTVEWRGRTAPRSRRAPTNSAPRKGAASGSPPRRPPRGKGPRKKKRR